MLIKKNIEYLGIDNPNTPKQVCVEIAGLKQAIKVAEELICRFEQALVIAELNKEENINGGLQKAGTGKDPETEEKEGDEEVNK